MSDFNVNTIENDAFNSEQFQYLEVLEMSFAPIRVLKSNAFRGMHRLRKIRMDSIELHEIHDDLLSPVVYLESFILRDCGEHVLNLNTMFGNVRMAHLTNVIVNRCNLKDTINEMTFSGLTNIQKLNLNSNQIERIGPRSFSFLLELTPLQMLFLEYNHLNLIPMNLFKYSKEREVRIYLNNNHFHCGCGLDDFQSFIKQSKNARFSLIACATPSKYEGHILQYSPSFCNIDIPNENRPQYKIITSDEDEQNN